MLNAPRRGSVVASPGPRTHPAGTDHFDRAVAHGPRPCLPRRRCRPPYPRALHERQCAAEASVARRKCWSRTVQADETEPAIDGPWPSTQRALHHGGGRLAGRGNITALITAAPGRGLPAHDATLREHVADRLGAWAWPTPPGCRASTMYSLRAAGEENTPRAARTFATSSGLRTAWFTSVPSSRAGHRAAPRPFCAVGFERRDGLGTRRHRRGMMPLATPTNCASGPARPQFEPAATRTAWLSSPQSRRRWQPQRRASPNRRPWRT